MCFSVEWLFHLAVVAVVIVAAIMIVQLLLPSIVGIPAVFMQIIRILIWAAVAIVLIWFLYDLLICSGFLRMRG
jgi:hypothetical protein